VKLVWSQQFQFINEAVATERQIKGWNRQKKQALIRGEFASMPEL
jgi:putative endonuclease